jgi:4-hydroxybenzoate polyprenyltransferase
MRSILRFTADMVMVTRPVLIIPVWGFCALGFQRAHILQQQQVFFVTHSHAAYLSILLFSLSVASVYILNQIADIEVDKENGGIPLIANGIISVPVSWAAAVISGLIPILTGIFLKQYIIAIASVTTIFLGYIYSFRPLRFSGRPIVDFLSNATGYGFIAFGLGWSCGGMSVVSPTFITAALPYFMLMCAGSISSTLPDCEGDSRDGKNTTTVVFGYLTAHKIAMTALIAALGFALHSGDLVAAICAGASLPFYFGYLYMKNRFFMEATYKIGGGLCMMAAFIGMPLFMIPSIIVFGVTWLYFRIRHGINYPSLVPVKNNR